MTQQTSERFRMFGFSKTGTTVILGVLIFALGILVGRESVWWNIRSLFGN